MKTKNLKTFYIQTNSEDYITDCIEYEYGDYIQVKLETPLPNAFIAGVYKYLGENQFEVDEDKYKQLFSPIEEIENVEVVE